MWSGKWVESRVWFGEWVESRVWPGEQNSVILPLSFSHFIAEGRREVVQKVSA